MSVKSKLRSRLLLAVAAAFVSILAAQTIIRFNWTLPQLDHLAHYNDQLDVKRVKNQISQQLNLNKNFTYDNGVWDENYSNAREKNIDWFQQNYFIKQTFAHQNLNGIYFYDAQGQLIVGMSANREFEFIVTPEFTDPAIYSPLLITTKEVQDNQQLPISKVQFIEVHGKAAVVTSQSIAPSNEHGPSAGTMLVWQFIDDKFVELLSPNGQQLVQQHQGADLDAIFPHLSSEWGSNDVDAQVYQGRLFIGVKDLQHKPLIAFSIPQSPRLYDRAIFDSSILAGLVMAIIVLGLFYFFIHKSMIQPVLKMLKTVSYVSLSSDYSQRTGLSGSSELHRLGELIDQLLCVVESNKQILQQQNEQLAALSNTDQLTSLANRRYLDQHLAVLSSHEANRQLPLSLLVIDIDFFKSFNDTFGHAEGDRILRQVAHALKQLTHGATDLVCRFGGEEFVVVLENTDKANAAHVADNLCRGIEQLKIAHGGKNASEFITISIGVATKPADHAIDSQQLFERADAALYRAKSLGRNRYVCADNA
ncbi:diguanylate cyclase [Shewanella avicenniae]|uniref:diguanylate cyclase n=1 Tax=Shewanella avicenniae TaxID=2814294 RepID=A0ABX7QTJ4_9GAMM|nr:diguanylate cyclase [Shewanella avicenniae]QSX34797.1 diguanylate cyclase [Shewanella avicenniae]